MDRTREQHNSHKGGTREKHYSHKWKNVKTKRRPAPTKQTLHNADQTLKLHHVRTPILLKKGRRLGEEYNTDHRREAIIYKETWMPGKPRSMFRFSIDLHLKQLAFPREGRRKSRSSASKEPCSSASKDPCSSVSKGPCSLVLKNLTA